jgi:hypothetical protein
MEKSKDSDYLAFCPVMSYVFDVIKYLDLPRSKDSGRTPSVIWQG